MCKGVSNGIEEDEDDRQDVRVHLRLGMCYILVLAELQHICRMDTQGDKSLLDAWAEMR